MIAIKINPNSGNVILDFAFLTPQQFFYTVEIADGDDNVKLSEKGQWDNKTTFDLGRSTDLVGLYLNIYWSVIDPNGAGNIIQSTVTASQDKAPCKNVMTLSGTTVEDAFNKMTFGKFTI